MTVSDSIESTRFSGRIKTHGTNLLRISFTISTLTRKSMAVALVVFGSEQSVGEVALSPDLNLGV
jgi:hypothetical protein